MKFKVVKYQHYSNNSQIESLSQFFTGTTGFNPISSYGGNLLGRVVPDSDIFAPESFNKRRGFCLDKQFLLLKGGRSGYNHCSQVSALRFFEILLKFKKAQQLLS